MIYFQFLSFNKNSNFFSMFMGTYYKDSNVADDGEFIISVD